MAKKYIGEHGIQLLVQLIKGIFETKQDKLTHQDKIDISKLSLHNIETPTGDNDAANKKYVDDAISTINTTLGNANTILDEILGNDTTT